MKKADNIPFVDLVTPHVELEAELARVFHDAIGSGMFVGGRAVEEFEASFAAFCGSDYCVAVSSGTDALRFAVIACGVKPGDVVITVPHTFIATAEAISQAGAIPEFVDIDERTYNMSAERLCEHIENECRRDPNGKLISCRWNRPVTAVVPVHLYGQMADMDQIQRVAEQNGLAVIEDACQAHGAEYFSRDRQKWLRAGSCGRTAAFSFYPGKNLGACGEGGAVTTSDSSTAVRIRMLRDHGQNQKYYHDFEGYNGRLDAIQASILQVKLAYLQAWNEERRKHAAEYNRLLTGQEGVICPYEPSWSKAVYHLYVIRVGDRDGLIKHLKDEGIGAGIHYPVPLHLQKAYASLGYKPDDLPVCTHLSSEILSLPMFPQLTGEQQVRVVREIARFSDRAQGVSEPLFTAQV